MTRPSNNKTVLSVVLPVYNEAGALKELFRRVNSAVAATGAKPEIIFVNDGSTDKSGELLDRLASEHPQVVVVHLSRNFGHQAAVQAGLAEARGHVVALMDSDLQDAPEAISRLLAKWHDGYDVVYAVRASRPEQLWKRTLFAGFHRLLAAVSDTPIPLDAGNFSLMDARVARLIAGMSEHDRYLPGLRSWVGFKQTGVEIRREPRYDGRPRVSLLGLMRLAKTAIYSFSTFPLLLFSIIGYSAFAVFLALSFFSISCRLFTDWAIPGWTTHVLVASFFGAVNALGITMLGQYAVRIYDQVRARPLYVVQRRTGQRASERSRDLTAYERLLADSTELLRLAETGATCNDRSGRQPRAAGGDKSSRKPQSAQNGRGPSGGQAKKRGSH